MDRPDLALAALIGGHYKAAGQALYDPQKLSPEERKKLSARLGLTGPAATITDFITNPWVLIPLAATLVTRLPGAGLVSTTSATDAWSRFAGQWIPVLSQIAPALERFKGSKLFPLAQRVQDDFHGLIRKWYGVVGDETAPGFGEQWASATEALGAPLTKEQQYELGARLGALNTPGKGSGKVWLVLRARLKQAFYHPDPTKREEALAWLHAGLPVDKVITKEIADDLLVRLDNPMPGFNPSAALDRHQAIGRDLLNKVFTESIENKEAVADILRATSIDKVRELIGSLPHVFGSPANWDNASLDAVAEMLAPYLDDYFPMVTEMNPKEMAASWIRADSRGGASINTLKQMLKGIAQRTGTNRILIRQNGMVPDADQFLAVGGDPVLADYLRLRAAQGDKVFSLNAGMVLPQYVENMARAMAWSVRNKAGTVAGNLIEEELVPLRAGLYQGSQMTPEYQRQMARYADEVVIPSLRGRLTPSQVGSATSWNAMRATVADWVRTPTTYAGAVFHKALGQKGAEAWAENLDRSPAYTLASVSSKLAGYIHGSTLVGNPLAASFNLLTIATNLAATVGWKSTVRGLESSFKEVGEYLALRGKGVPGEKAFRTAFSEYHRQLLELGSTEKQNFMETLEGVYRQGFNVASGGPISRGLAKFHQLANVFGATEHFNRLTSYHASKDYALRTFKHGDLVYDAALGKDVAITAENLPGYARAWAKDNVGRTQFGSDVLQKPGFLADWNPLLRQFTTFPLRMVNLLANAPAATLSRLALASGALYAGGQAMGADLSRGLLLGGLPAVTDPEYTPFAPLPLVSPALQVVGGAALAAAGKPEYLQRSLPLFVPGGIPLARAVGMVPGVGRHVAPLIGRQYVDDRNPTPDGRYPVYTSNGSLVGYFSPPELIARGIGLPVPNANAEQAITKFMIANRERVTAMKRAYMDALYNNDASDAQRIREEYEAAFPNMGGLPVKPSDVRALHMRRNVSRLERVLDTMPAQTRPQFMAAIAVSMGAQPEQFLGLLENGFQDGTTLDRDPFRAYNMSSVKRRVGEGLHGVSLPQKLRAAGVESSYDYDRRRDSGTFLGSREESYLQ